MAIKTPYWRTVSCGAALVNSVGAPVGAANSGMVPLELVLLTVAALAAATAACAVANCAGVAVFEAVGPFRSYVTPHCNPHRRNQSISFRNRTMSNATSLHYGWQTPRTPASAC